MSEVLCTRGRQAIKLVCSTSENDTRAAARSRPSTPGSAGSRRQRPMRSFIGRPGRRARSSRSSPRSPPQAPTRASPGPTIGRCLAPGRSGAPPAGSPRSARGCACRCSRSFWCASSRTWPRATRAHRRGRSPPCAGIWRPLPPCIGSLTVRTRARRRLSGTPSRPVRAAAAGAARQRRSQRFKMIAAVPRSGYELPIG
jgi:hypothetical protein